MPDTASELARHLAANAEAVCGHYLSNGRREGRWWTVGDIHNSPGRSMMVRLKSTDRGPAGKWTDYVARPVMLRPGAGRRCCERSASPTQHNLSPSGSVA